MPFGSSFTVVTAAQPDGPDGALNVTLRQNSEFALGPALGGSE